MSRASKPSVYLQQSDRKWTGETAQGTIPVVGNYVATQANGYQFPVEGRRAK